MSLTSELRKSGSTTSAFVDRWRPRLREMAAQINADVRTATFLPFGFEPGYPYMLVGTAIDYRLRLFFTRDVLDSDTLTWGFASLNQIKTVEEQEDGQLRPVPALYDRGTFRKLQEGIGALIGDTSSVQNTLPDAEEEALCRCCLLLASVDHFMRGGARGDGLRFLWSLRRYGFKRMLAEVDGRMSADLVRLSRAFAEANGELIREHRSATVGGTMTGSADVGGADFDLLADGCLFDLKTTKNPTRSGLMLDGLRQLLGYALLDYDDAHAIRALGIILPRQARTYRFPLVPDIIGSDPELAAARAEFREALARDPSARRRALGLVS